MIRSRWGCALVVIMLASVTACDWFEDRRPTRAEVMIDGIAPNQVHVITSTRFVAGVDEQNITRVVVFESDTTFAMLPFHETYSIRGDYQFFVQASRLDADVPDLRVRVFIDSSKEFDENGPLLDGTPYRFVYLFNQPVTRTIEVEF